MRHLRSRPRRAPVVQAIGGACLAALLLVVVGCTASPSRSPGGEATAPSTPTTATVEYNAADLHFAQSLAPHHDQAVEMSKMILAKPGIDAQVRQLATQIMTSRETEISTLNGWLSTWNQPEEPPHTSATEGGGADHHSGNGLMNETQMQQLDEADTSTGQKLYLRGMTTHHEGALDLAQAEIVDGQHPAAVAMATAGATTQRSELAQLKDVLARLP